VRAQALSQQVAEHLAAARAAMSSDPAEARRRLALARNLEPAHPEVAALTAQLDAAAPPQAPPAQEAAVAQAPEPAVEEDEAPSRGGGRAPRRGRSSGGGGSSISTADVIN